MRLTLEEMIHYQTEGYVVANHVLTDGDLAPVIAELEQIIDRRAHELMNQGKLQQLFVDEPFNRRLLKLHEQCPEISQGLNIMQYRGKAIFDFLTNDNLLDAVECVLGSEIMCNPVHHLRGYLPTQINPERLITFMHQDAVVLTEDARDSDIITCWIPMVDATEENGCLQLMPGVFKQGLLNHGDTNSVATERMTDFQPKPVPCPKGGMVIMNKYTPHTGLKNRSDTVRWTIDLRFHKIGAPSGRAVHPSFVARSRKNPAAVLKNHAEWSALWEEALKKPQAGSQTTAN